MRGLDLGEVKPDILWFRKEFYLKKSKAKVEIITEIVKNNYGISKDKN